MIDRETAIAWAKEAGFSFSLVDWGVWLSTPERIQSLITRAIEIGRAEQADSIATLELENRMLRERNERLEAENITLREKYEANQ